MRRTRGESSSSRQPNGSDSHVVVREGLLLEKVYKSSPSSTSTPFDELYQDDYDQDNWEVESTESGSDEAAKGSSGGTQGSNAREYLGLKPLDALLFANGNLILRPHEKKGFKIWPFKRSKAKPDKPRVIPLDTCAFKKIKYEWENQVYVFHLYPQSDLSKEIAIACTTERAANDWFNDLIGVAAIARKSSVKSVSNKTGQSNESIELIDSGEATGRHVANIMRARAGWKQAFYDMKASIGELPIRFWNEEFSPQFSKNDPIKCFRLWRDFMLFSMLYAKQQEVNGNEAAMSTNESLNGTSQQQTTLPFMTFSSLTAPPQNFQEARMGDAIQLFFDAKGVLLILNNSQEDQATTAKLQLQPSASILCENGEKALVAPVRPAVLDSEDRVFSDDSYDEEGRTVFSERFPLDETPFHRAILCALPDVHGEPEKLIPVLIPTSREKRDAVILALLSGFHFKGQPFRQERHGVKYLFLRHSNQVPENQFVSSLFQKTIRGNVLMFPSTNAVFVDFVGMNDVRNKPRGVLMRPEYPSCRLQLFREHFLRGFKVKRVEPSKAAPLQRALLESRRAVTHDMYVNGTFAAAMRVKGDESLIRNASQVISLLHHHGVPVDAQSLSLFVERVKSDRVKRIVAPDLVLHRYSGNLTVALMALQHLTGKKSNEAERENIFKAEADKLEVAAAWSRLSGTVLEVRNLVSGPINEMTSLEELSSLSDLNYEGINRSYLVNSSEALHIQRLSRGVNRFTIHDQIDLETFKQYPVESRNPLILTTTVLNEATYSVEHNFVRNEKKVQAAALYPSQVYASAISKVFHSSHITRQAKNSKASQPLNKKFSRAEQQQSQQQLQQKELWWLQSQAKVPMELAASLSWIQVALSRVNQAILSKKQDSFRAVIDALDCAEEMVRSHTSMHIIPCAIIRAFLETSPSLILFAVRLLVAQPFVKAKRAIVSLLNILLGLPGLSASETVMVHKVIWKYDGQVKPIKRRGLGKVAQKVLLRQDLLEPFLFQTNSLVTSYEVESLLEFYFNQHVHAYERDSLFQRENSVLSIHLQVFPPRNMSRGKTSSAGRSLPHGPSSYAEDSGSGNSTRGGLQRSSTVESRNSEDSNSTRVRKLSTQSDDSKRHSAKNETLESNIVSKLGAGNAGVYVIGPSEGLSNEQEQQLARMEANGMDSDDPAGFDSPLNSSDASVSASLFSLGANNNNSNLSPENLRLTRLLPDAVLSKRLPIVKVSCGHRHSAILTKGGILLTFGHGGGGRLGHGNEDSIALPAIVNYFVEDECFVRDVECGRDHTIAICDQRNRSGVAFGWGWGEAGRLGQGKEIGVQSVPLRINVYREGQQALATESYQFVAAACGFEHTLLLSSDGKLFSCGAGGYGRLGLGDGEDQLTPTRILSNIEDEVVIAVAAGHAHSLALTSRGVVYSWGFGRSGALGHGDADNRFEPKRIAILEDTRQVQQIGCGAYHSMALDTKGRVWAWGDKGNGHLGIDTLPNSTENCIPRMVRFKGKSSEGATITQLHCGEDTTVVVDSGGNIFKWGSPDCIVEPVLYPTKAFVTELTNHRRSTSTSEKSIAPLISVGTYHSLLVFPLEDQGQSLQPELEPVLKRMETIIGPNNSVNSKNVNAANDIGNPFGLSFRSEFNQPFTTLAATQVDYSSDLHAYFTGMLDPSVSLASLDQFTTESTERCRELVALGYYADIFPDVLVKGKPQPNVFSAVPKVIEGLSGFPINSCAGDLQHWHFVTKDMQLFKWGVTMPAPDLMEEFQFQDLSCCGVFGSATGEWTASLVQRDQSRNSASMLIWRDLPASLAVETKSDMNPVLVWPFHDDMALKQVAVSSDRLVILDKDGLLYQVCSPKGVRAPPSSLSKFRPGGQNKQERVAPPNPLFAERIERFYKKYCPEKLRTSPDFVQTMLNLYRNQENKLIDMLTSKYGPEPTTREARSPTGFERAVPNLLSLPNSMRSKVVQVACGTYHALALTEAGAVFSWGGLPNSPALGIGPPPFQTFQVPQKVRFTQHGAGKTLIARIAAGGEMSACISLGGALFTWGDGRFGSLGHGNQVCQFSPKQVSYFSRDNYSVARVSCGLRHTVVVTTCGRAFTFGFSPSGALGLSTENLPTVVSEPQPVSFVHANSVQGEFVRVFDAVAGPTSTVFLARHQLLSL